jgi:excisionase family DNA binding protein
MMKLPDTTRDAATLAPFPSVAQFTREEAISRSTVARLAAQGKIEILRVGRSARINRASWHAYLATCPRAAYRVDGKERA